MAKKLVAAIVLLGALAGGGSYFYFHYHHDRSVAAYCHIFYGQGAAIRSEFASSNSQNDPLQAAGAIFSAPSQLSGFFQQLKDAAPLSIEPAVATIQQAFQAETNQLASGNLISALLGGLADGLSSSGAVDQVNAWTLKHCGPPPGR